MAGIRPTSGLVARMTKAITEGANKAAQPKVNVAAVRHYSTDDNGPKTNQPVEDPRKTNSQELQETMQKIKDRFAAANEQPHSSQSGPSPYAGILTSRKGALLTDAQKEAFAANLKTPEQLKAEAKGTQPLTAGGENQAPQEEAGPSGLKTPPPPPPPLAGMPPAPPPPPLAEMPALKMPAAGLKPAKPQGGKNAVDLLFEELKARARPELQDPKALEESTQKWERIYQQQGSALDAYRREVQGLDAGRPRSEIQLSAAQAFAENALGEVELDVKGLIRSAFGGAKTMAEMEAKAVKGGEYVLRMLEVIKAYPSLYDEAVSADGTTSSEEDLSARIVKRLGVSRNRFSYVDDGGGQSKIFLVDTAETVLSKLSTAALKGMSPEQFEKLISEQSKATIVKTLFKSPMMRAYEKQNGTFALNHLKGLLNQEIAKEPTLKGALISFYEKHGAGNFKAASYQGMQEENRQLKDEVAALKAKLAALEGK